MALNKAGFKAKIVELHTDMRTKETDAIEEYAERLSTIIDDYIKSAKIVYTAGLMAPNGAVSGTFNGNLE